MGKLNRPSPFQVNRGKRIRDQFTKVKEKLLRESPSNHNNGEDHDLPSSVANLVNTNQADLNTTQLLEQMDKPNGSDPIGSNLDATAKELSVVLRDQVTIFRSQMAQEIYRDLHPGKRLSMIGGLANTMFQVYNMDRLSKGKETQRTRHDHYHLIDGMSDEQLKRHEEELAYILGEHPEQKLIVRREAKMTTVSVEDKDNDPMPTLTPKARAKLNEGSK